MIGFRANDQEEAPMGIGGKLFLSLFGLVFLGAGLLIGWVIVRGATAGLQTWSWRKTDCEITASAIRQQNQGGNQNGDFFFEVKYRYTFNGRQYSSDQYKRSAEKSEDYNKIARLTERYPPGSSALCYVNPSAPSQAVLVRYNLFSLLLVLFPVPFAGFGAWAVYYAWFRKSAGEMAAQPISDRASPPRGLWIVVLFFSAFLLIGCAALYGFFLRPAFKILGARSWPAVPCAVISSEVKSHEGGANDGTTYSVNIFYSYEIKGREFKANTYDFMGGSSSGYEGKQAVVARYPRGTNAVCYVNPDDPTDVALERGFTPRMWIGLLPLLFVMVGAVGLVWLFHSAWVARATRLCRRATGPADPRIRRLAKALLRACSPSLPVPVGESPTGTGGSPVLPTEAVRGAHGAGTAVAGPALSSSGRAERLVLKPAVSPWTMLFGLMFICLFWNGIVSVFVVQSINSWRYGHPEWGMMILQIPFVVIGLGIIGGVFYWLLAVLNPRPHLLVTPGAVPLGGTLQVQWNFTGRAGVLRNLRLRLEGREESASRGENSNTITSIFANLEFANVATPREMRSGEARVTIPASLVPSLAGAHNKIIWAIQVHGQTARGPDVKAEFPVTVLPAATAARL